MELLLTSKFTNTTIIVEDCHKRMNGCKKPGRCEHGPSKSQPA